jgi:hypothetical protein
MNLEEAKNQYSELDKICSLLPDETNITKDQWGNYAFRFSLMVGQVISDEIVRDSNYDIFIEYYIKNWYKSLHEQLIQSEVNYRLKMQKKNDESLE